MNQRAIFYTASLCLRQLALAAVITEPPSRKPGTRPGFLLINGLGRLVSGPGSGSVDLAFGWGSDPAGLVPDRILSWPGYWPGF